MIENSVNAIDLAHQFTAYTGVQELLALMDAHKVDKTGILSF